VNGVTRCPYIRKMKSKFIIALILFSSIAYAADSEYTKVNCGRHPKVDLSLIQEVEVESKTIRIKTRTKGDSLKSTYATCSNVTVAKEERIRLLRAWRHHNEIRGFDFCYPKYYNEKF